MTGVTYSTPQPTEAERQALLAKQQAERDAENARIVKENADNEIRLEAERIKRNAGLQASWDSGRFRKDDESWAAKPGTGYHFSNNFRGSDGNFYAQYKSNRGTNRRYYSISERKWVDEWRMSAYRCGVNECDGLITGLNKYDRTCPKCGDVKAKQ